jgi:protein SCO1/2
MKKQIGVGMGLMMLAVLAFFLFKNLNRTYLYEVMPVPSFELMTEENQTLNEKDMLGKVYLVEFFFTNCPTICPVMKSNLIDINHAIDHPDFGVISITIDPKRDTPQILKTQKERLGIKNPNWHFLTGERDYIYKVSKEFNIFIGKDYSTAEGLNHSGKIALVDKKGIIRSRYNEKGMPILYYSGLNYSDKEGKMESLGGEFHPDIEFLKEDILKLLNE